MVDDMPSISTSPTSYAQPSPTLTNPDMILPAMHDAPDSPATPTQPQRPPSLSGIQARAQSADRALDGKRTPNGTYYGPNIERIRTKGRRSFGESLGADDGRSDLRKGPRSSQIRLNGASSSSSSSAVDSTTNTLIGDALPPTSNFNEPSWNKAKYMERANDDSEGPSDEHQDARDNNEDDYNFPQTGPKHVNGIITTVERGDPYSHAQMSIRAEQILQNAKRRLTAMEGNLNRARSKLGGRPSSSMSSFIDEDDESEPTAKGILSAKRRDITSPAKHRQNHAQATNSNGKGHLRVVSETSVPSSLQSPPRESIQDVDAIGESGNEGSAKGDSQGWPWGGQSHGSRHQNTLPALNEDEVPIAFDSSPLGSPDSDLSGPNFGNRRQSSRSPETRNLSSGNLTRAHSTTQMRDLRDQMQDLKGKISSLKQRAREDSLRRRSMQSLRTASPFTNAEDWYLGAPSHRAEQSEDIKIHSSQEDSPREQQQPTALRQQSPPPPSGEIEGPRNLGLAAETELSESHTNQKLPPELVPLPLGQDSPTDLQDAPASPLSESLSPTYADNSNDQPQSAEIEDSLYGDHEYHETSPHPTTTTISSELSHEDRADAFDYEHFILHSAMGSIGGQRLSRTSSHSSMYSVETTRPTATASGTEDKQLASSPRKGVADEEDISPKTIISSKKVPGPTIEAGKRSQHARNISGESVSTVATFATATEGGSKANSDEADNRPSGENKLYWNANITPSRQLPDLKHIPQQATKQRISKAPAPPAIVTAHPHHRYTNSAGASASPMSPGEATPLPKRAQSLKHQEERGESVKSSHRHHHSSNATSSNNSLTPDTPTILSLLSALATPSSPNNPSSSNSTTSSTTSPTSKSPHTHSDSAPSSSSGPLPQQDLTNLSLADTDLVQRLVTSLAKVCRNLHTDGAVGERGRGRQWRRRLDGARRVLDGEVNGEVF